MPLPYKPEDSGQEILNWQNWFQRAYRSYAPPATGVYDAASAAATRELQRRLALPITGTFDWTTASHAGFRVPRHLGIVFRGTGGVIGLDYVSRVLQAVSDLVEEVNPNWPATMGGIPVGTAGSTSDPSMQHAVTIAFEDAKRIFLARRAANPNIKVVVGGYSAGAVAAAKFREWLLTYYPENYLCSFSIGDPTRPAGGCYFAGTPTPGRGISSWRYGDVKDWRHCWLAQPGDMYTAVPDNATGDVLQDGYDGITNVELSDPLTTAQTIIQMILRIMADSGIGLPSIATSVLTGPAGIVSWLIPFLISALKGLVDGISGKNLGANGPSAEAGVEAAMIGLKFVADNPPTRAHITYEFGEVWPGQTYLGLAIQHVRDYASRVLPT
ncbi:hypothetical protein [Mycobacterium intracellulare]|uniref:Lysin B n=1 Tax=Mycobacterium intracellulare TaxID=1767 RepID=A0AAE4R7V6_MYCIT|nr:hypothetical protein [Mycobacterium intracellulare]MDV6975326.1 hypothetical protein [Mycobacterium intracellulare]MDV6980390.1 hypothetical protein [Mycobacterium intracellulare]MDV7010819.1 hypothetical protein [Mycobacterium intracellulare]MDV7025725.1 hypothetical protein [Mycobacterium intracellulare]